MNEEEVGLVAEQLLAHELDGVTATNTSGRVGVESSVLGRMQILLLSGRPLTAHSTTTLSLLATHIDGRMAIIGVGGIMTGSDAVSKWRAGADLVNSSTAVLSLWAAHSLLSVLRPMFEEAYLSQCDFIAGLTHVPTREEC